MTAAQWQAAAAVGTFLVATATAAFAVYQIRLTRSTRKEQTAPYVIAYFESKKESVNLIDFVVKNIGSTPAFEIKLQIDPPMVRANEIVDHLFMEAKIIAEGISMLVPQQEYRVFFENVVERKGKDMPSTFEVAISAKTSKKEALTVRCNLDIDWGRGSVF